MSLYFKRNSLFSRQHRIYISFTHSNDVCVITPYCMYVCVYINVCVCVCVFKEVYQNLYTQVNIENITTFLIIFFLLPSHWKIDRYRVEHKIKWLISPEEVVYFTQNAFRAFQPLWKLVIQMSKCLSAAKS